MDKIDAVPGARSTDPQCISNTRGREHRSDEAMRDFRLFGTGSRALRSACSVGCAAAGSVCLAGFFHLPHPYMALVFATVLSTLPRPTFRRLLYRIAALTLGACCSILLLAAFPEEPWFYIPLLSAIASAGYAFILYHWGPGAACAFSFFFLAIHISSIASGFHKDVIISALQFWFQAFIAMIVSYLAMFFLPREKKSLTFPKLPLPSVITIAIVVGIAALINASIKTDQGGRLMMGAISTITGLEIAQSAHDFPLKIIGYVAGIMISFAFIIIVAVSGNDFAFYLLSLGLVFAALEWLACHYKKWMMFYSSAAMMLSFLALMLPRPDSSLEIAIQRMSVSFLGCFIAIAVFVMRRELGKFTALYERKDN